MPNRIVICCDGTSNTPNDDRPTSITRIARGVSPQAEDGSRQVVFYDWGVGTSGKIDALSGGGCGQGLAKNVEDAYRFIVHNFESGDEIFIFGFSRGAFTARSIAGLIRNCGILRKEEAGRIAEAYSLYRRRDDGPDSNDAVKFRADFSTPTDIKFVGVFDTVGALGIPTNRVFGTLGWYLGKLASPLIFFNDRAPDRFRKTAESTAARIGKILRKFGTPAGRHGFHDMSISRIVNNAYQVLAIDELRPIFSPVLWSGKPDVESGQVIEQVWFAGVHSDVGGSTTTGSTVGHPLRWMSSKAALSGLEFTDTFNNELARVLALPGSVSSSPPSFWKLAGWERRKIGTTVSGTESIHSSAIERYDESLNGYRPINITRYLAAHRQTEKPN